MASEKPIQRRDLSVEEPFKIIRDDAVQTAISVSLLRKDLEAMLPLTEKISKGQPNSVTDIQAQAQALKALNVQTEKARKFTADSIRLKTAQQALIQKSARTRNILNNEKRKEENFSKREEKQLKRNADAYFQLSDKYTLAANKLRTLNAMIKMGKPLTKTQIRLQARLTKDVEIYGSAIEDVDRKSRRHHRNIGNYKSGFDGLGNSMAQLTREAPAFGNSMQTGFMAISNNLPIFFDEMARAKKEIRELRAEGKPTQSMLQRLGSSFFSLQTLLSVGVTLLTLFGAKLVDWVSSLSNASDETERLNKERERANKLSKESREFIASESKEFSVLLLRIKSTNEGSKERSTLISQANEQYGTTLKNMSDEAMFQAQINAELSKYLKYKEAEFKIKQNEDYIQSLLNKKQKAELDLKQRKLMLDKESAKYGQFGGPENVFERDLLAKLNDEYSKSEAHLNNIVSELERSGMVIQKLSGSMDDFGYKRAEATKEERVQKEKLVKVDKEIYELKELKIKQQNREGMISPEKVERALQLENERASTLAKIAVTEAEIARLDAKNGSKKDQIKAEKELTDAKIEQIKLELQLAKKQENDPAKIKDLEKTAELQIKTLEASGKQAEGSKEGLKELGKTALEVNKIVVDYLDSVMQAEIDSIKAQIEQVNQSYDLLKAKAIEGNNVANESLKEQARLQNELREIERDRIEQLEKIKLFSQILNTGVGALLNGAGGQGGGGLAGIAGFREGTESGNIGDALKGRGALTVPKLGYDDTLIRVNKNEGIMREDHMKAITGHTMSEVVGNHLKMVEFMQNPQAFANHFSSQSAPEVNVNVPVTQIIDATQQGFSFMTKSMEGNTIKTSIHKVKFPRK